MSACGYFPRRYSVGSSSMPCGTRRSRRDELMDVRAIRESLGRHVAIPDDAFDHVFPWTQRRRSNVYWTPIDVALRVTDMLASAPGGHVLDVGAGAGKMCLIGALTGDEIWSGVERCGFMVRAARRAAAKLGVDKMTAFLHADAIGTGLDSIRWHLLVQSVRRGIVSPLRGSRVPRGDVPCRGPGDRAPALDPRLGARVVTYAGFGGALPSDFDLVEHVQMRGESLALWIRTSQSCSRRG